MSYTLLCCCERDLRIACCAKEEIEMLVDSVLWWRRERESFVENWAGFYRLLCWERTSKWISGISWGWVTSYLVYWDRWSHGRKNHNSDIHVFLMRHKSSTFHTFPPEIKLVNDRRCSSPVVECTRILTWTYSAFSLPICRSFSRFSILKIRERMH